MKSSNKKTKASSSEQEQTEKRREITTRTVLLLFVAVLAVCLFAGQKPDSANVMIQTPPVVELDGAWTQAGQDCVTVLPKSLPDGSLLELGGMNGPFTVKLKGRTIFKSAGDDAATALRWIPLPKGSAGSKLTVQGSGAAKQLLSILNAASAIGSGAALQRRLFWSNIYALIFFIYCACAAALIFYAALRQRRRQRSIHPGAMGILGLFLLCAGVWVLTDSQMLQLVTDKVNRGAMVSVIAFFMMPVLLLQFLETLLPKVQIFRNLEKLFLLNLAIGLILHMTGWVAIYQCVMTNHLLIIGLTIVVVRCFSKEKGRRPSAIEIGSTAYLVCELAALAAYYLQPTSRVYARILCLGVLFLSIGCLEAWFNQYLEVLSRIAKSELYRKLAYRDELTGLGNRAAYERDWDQVKPEETAALVMFDINGLKMTNDTWGHTVGDKLIQVAAEEIVKTFDEIGTVYRIGGDEFLVILKGRAVQAAAQRLDDFSARKRFIDHGIAVQIAWGMASTAEVPAAACFHLADQRMYQKKREMHDKVCRA